MPIAQLDAAHAWLGVVCYTLQIYFDFSGYSDMAIGLGRMFGFRFPGEFPLAVHRRHACRNSGGAGTCRCRRGFATTSTSRSAATASRRRGRTRNLVTVFFLCGLWHGASWNFVIWGLFHGAFLVLERLGLASARQAPVAAAASRVPDAGRDGRLGVLPRRHAAERDGVPAGDVRLASRRRRRRRSRSAWYLTPEVWLALVAGVIGRRRRAGAVGVAHGAPDAVARVWLRRRGDGLAHADSRRVRSCRWPRAPTTRSSISGSDATRFLNLVLVAGFLVIIALPAGRQPGRQRRRRSGGREPRPRHVPDIRWTWKSAVAWPNGFDAGFRIISGSDPGSCAGTARPGISGCTSRRRRRSSADKNGWLYYADDGGLEDYTNETAAARRDRQLAQTIVRARDWCRAHGIAYVFTIRARQAR